MRISLVDEHETGDLISLCKPVYYQYLTNVPPSGVRPKVFTLTLTEAEHDKLMALAAQEGRSAANWLRHAIAAAELTAPPKTKRPKRQ